MTDQEILDGYDVLFPANLRLAHEAVLTAAAELSDDGWPTPAMIVKWAKCYDVPVVELAGLCGILVSKVGRRTVFSDSRRHPYLVNRLNAAQWSRRALVCYGFYNVAVEMTMRDRAAIH